VPAVKLPTAAETCKTLGIEPLVGDTVSQEESEEAVNAGVPVPVVVTLRLAGAGFAPPCGAVKVIDDGDTTSVFEAVTPYAESGHVG